MARIQAQTTSCEALAADLADAQARLSAFGNMILSYKRRVDSGGNLTWEEVDNLIDITCRIKGALARANLSDFPSQCSREQLEQYVSQLADLDAKATALEDRLALGRELRRCRPITLPDGTQRPVSEKSPAAKETVAALRSADSLLSAGNGTRI